MAGADFFTLHRNVTSNVVSRTLDWPGGHCLMTVSGTFGAARASLQIQNARTGGEWIEMDYDFARSQPSAFSPLWIEACSLRAVITDADQMTDLDVIVQRV